MSSCPVHQQALYRQVELQCCLWETEGIASLPQSGREVM